MPAEPTRSDEELLAAYCDGVTELTGEERKRVDALLATSGALRADEAATRSLLGALRELPAEGEEPDWLAMERAIRARVPDHVPRQWWRPVWRWLVPATALAMLAVLALVLFAGPDAPATPGTEGGERSTTQPLAAAVDAGAPLPAVSPATRVAVRLDGEDVVLDAADDELLEVDDLLLGEGDTGGKDLLTADDLAWIDQLDDEDAAFAEQWLDERKKG